MQEFNLVFVGHIDHGKSTFIGRLLYDSNSLKPDKIEEVKRISASLGKEMDFAYFTDNLEEEREQEITIDIFKTKFKSQHLYNLTDCPGHKEFIKNMLTGASRAEAALLILSAKQGEGIQDQTKRHLFLLKMLGINQLFVGINKMDLVNYDEKRFEQIKQELIPLLEKIGYSKVPIVPISAKKGDNILKKSKDMQWYNREPLIKIIDENIKKTPQPTFLRAVVQGKQDDILFIKMQSGILKKQQEVFFNDSEIKQEVKTILSGFEEKQQAKAGDVVGIKIQDSEKVSRGDIISSIENKPEKLSEIKADIFVLEPFSLNNFFIFKGGSIEKKVKLKLSRKIEVIGEDTNNLEDQNLEELQPTEAAQVQISFNNPAIIESFSKFEPLGRFLLLDDKNKKIVCIGIIK